MSVVAGRDSGSVGAAAVLLDLEGRVLGCSRTAAAMWDVPDHEIPGRSFAELALTEWAAGSFAEALRRLGGAADPPPERWHVTAPGPDGDEVVLDLAVERLDLGADPVVLLVVAPPAMPPIASLPTERALEALFERAPEIITVTDSDGRQRTVNRAGLRLLGLDDDLRRPPDGRELVHPEDRARLEAHRASLPSLGSGEEPPVHEGSVRFRVRVADGSWRWLETVTADLSDIPEVGGRVAFSRDVTEEEERAQALREAKARLEALIGGFRGGALLHDTHGDVVLANDRIASWGGSDDGPGVLVERSAADVLLGLTGDDDGPLRADLLAVQAGERASMQLSLLDGRIVELEHVAIRRGGDDLGGLWLAHDVTERRAAERRREELLVLEREAREQVQTQLELLHQADQMRDQFLASLSHDLRTPLTSIASASELLLDASPSLDDQARSYVELIGRNASRLGVMFDDLLLAGRLGEGMLELEAVEVPIEPIVADAVRLVTGAGAAEERGIRLTVTVSVGVALVDPLRLTQVVENLVSNAVRFSPDGGEVRVDARREGASGWLLCVRDEGPGIPVGERERVFERFRRLADPRNGGATGSGLGLAIVRGLVELHGGTVEVRAARGGGAEVVCHLPDHLGRGPVDG